MYEDQQLLTLNMMKCYNATLALASILSYNQRATELNFLAHPEYRVLEA